MKTTLSIIIALALIGGASFLTKKSAGSSVVALNNVTVENGVQIVEIMARGGYQPRHSTAKAGVPTVIRFNTDNTFDCSASVRIPSLNISKSLPLSGSTDIDVGTQLAGVLQGSCGMGMYPFEVEFKS